MQLYLIFVLLGLIFTQHLFEKKYEKDFENISQCLSEIEETLEEICQIISEDRNTSED